MTTQFTAIEIKTKVGYDTYMLLLKQFGEYKEMGLGQLEAFKTRCMEDYSKAEGILGVWLDNDNLS